MKNEKRFGKTLAAGLNRHRGYASLAQAVAAHDEGAVRDFESAAKSGEVIRII